MTDEIILVDHRDNDIGSEEKDACHRLPVKLHRAFSIFILNKSMPDAYPEEVCY